MTDGCWRPSRHSPPFPAPGQPGLAAVPGNHGRRSSNQVFGSWNPGHSLRLRAGNLHDLSALGNLAFDLSSEGLGRRRSGVQTLSGCAVARKPRCPISSIPCTNRSSATPARRCWRTTARCSPCAALCQTADRDSPLTNHHSPITAFLVTGHQSPVTVGRENVACAGFTRCV